MTAAATRLLTVEEWGKLDEDIGGELVDGVLVEEEMPSFVRETVVLWLATLLHSYFRPRAGYVASSGVKLAIRPRRGRMADVVAFDSGRRPEAHGVVRVPPTIAIEVVSREPKDERRDRIEKPDDYAEIGVKYYWLVDPELRTFEIWELGADGRYVRAVAKSEGKIETIPGCEGMLVDLDALWAEVDRVAAPL